MVCRSTSRWREVLREVPLYLCVWEEACMYLCNAQGYLASFHVDVDEWLSPYAQVLLVLFFITLEPRGE